LQKNNFIFQKQARGSLGASQNGSIRLQNIQIQGQGGGESDVRNQIPASNRLSQD